MQLLLLLLLLLMPDKNWYFCNAIHIDLVGILNFK
jgi:hypothetical protein